MMTAAGSHTQTIRRQDHDGPRPLSYPQERLFLLDWIMPGLPAYNVPTLVRVGATLDEDVLAQALNTIVGRHEILRTRIRLIGGVPAQEIFGDAEVELSVSDLRSDTERESRAQALQGEFARRPFDELLDLFCSLRPRRALTHPGVKEHIPTQDLECRGAALCTAPAREPARRLRLGLGAAGLQTSRLRAVSGRWRAQTH
jgi:hypothetical protein